MVYIPVYMLLPHVVLRENTGLFFCFFSAALSAVGVSCCQNWNSRIVINIGNSQ